MRNLVCAVCVTLGACAPGLTRGETEPAWVASWQGAPQLVEPRNMPPVPGLAGMTLRQRLHLTLGGERARLRLSNEFGDRPLTVSAAHLSRSAHRDTLLAEGGMRVTFGGASAVTIRAGDAVWSDAIVMRTGDLDDVTASVHFTNVPDHLTGHPGSRASSFVVPGNHVADASLAGATVVEHWYVVSGVEVLRRDGGAVVAILGNSIADGRGSTTDQNNRWPDQLARRLHANPATQGVGVSNAGLGGNAVLRGGLGPTALMRFERDILDQRGVRWVIVSEGVNDIGGAPDSAASATVATELLDAYRRFIAQAHARHLRVYGATILPFAGSQYDTPAHDRARNAVNAWIRDSGAFDAVIDFDLATRDSSDNRKLRRDVDSGDHLHLNPAGYAVMAAAIDLRLFSVDRVARP